jgi:hypothetical protein
MAIEIGESAGVVAEIVINRAATYKSRSELGFASPLCASCAAGEVLRA